MKQVNHFGVMIKMPEQVLVSQKKTCSQDRLLRVLSAIAYLGVNYEGEGGQTQGYIGGGYGDGDYFVGTGLRAPDMPLYYKPKTSRRAVLKHLEDNGLITVKEHEEDEWKGFEVTVKGLIALEAYNKCPECGQNLKWYKYTSFIRTSPISGFKTGSRKMVCECELEKYKGIDNIGFELIKPKEVA